MLRSHCNNNVIMHERCPWLIYNGKSTFVEEVMLKDGLVTIHHKNIQKLAIGIYKVKNYLSPEIASNNFCLQK